MAKNTKPVSDLAKTIANLGLNFAEKQVEKKIADPLVEQGVKLVFPVTRELLEVLNDENPANAEQVKDVVMDFLNDDLTAFLTIISTKVLEGIENPHHRALLDFAFGTAIAFLQTYTDHDQNNKEQIDALVSDFIHSGKLSELAKSAIVVPVMDKAGASDDLKAFVAKALDIIFDAVEKK
jgi:hypothetical protein